jgi:hypothetical protein
MIARRKCRLENDHPGLPKEINDIKKEDVSRGTA